MPSLHRTCLCIASLVLISLVPSARAEVLTQPVAPLKPVTDDYFGTKVTDSYRWMEDLKSPEVQKWMKGQADYTKDFLSKLPGREEMVKRVEELDNASVRVGALSFYKGRYFYFKLTAKDTTPKLYARDGERGEERLLVDPQVLGGDATKRFTLSGFFPSPDGKLVAVEIAAGGAEEGNIRVIDATTGKVLTDDIDRIWGASVSWDESGKFFYYMRLQKLGPKSTPLDKELNMASYLHHLGQSSDKDVCVMGRVAFPALGMIPTDAAFVSVTPGSPYSIGVVAHGVKNEVTIFISPADAVAQGKPTWTKIVDVDDDVTNAALKGHELWVISHKDASKFKVLHLDLDHPDIKKADVTVAASDRVVKGVATGKDALYVDQTEGGISHLLRVEYAAGAAPVEVKLPFAGSIMGEFVDVDYEGALLRLAGWTEAPQWYALDPTGKLTNTNVEPLNPTDFSGITSVEVTAPSADGTMVPMSIIYKKDLKMDGQNPCLMEGYGSYGISIDPGFDATRLALLEKGIVIAYPHVRGGGENGEDWHIDGQKLKKQNTISDFIACAEYLIKNGYTSPSKLAGRGTSAGGILIGGALTQRPDLFGLAIVNVGVENTLRMEMGPNGAVNTPEFGSVKDEEGFKGLLAMDALSHVKDGTAYPTVLLITGANDPRVDPWHLFKMAARLQAATSSKNPVLLRIDYDAGHGMGSSKIQRDLITADQAALLLSRASMTPPKG